MKKKRKNAQKGEVHGKNMVKTHKRLGGKREVMNRQKKGGWKTMPIGAGKFSGNVGTGEKGPGGNPTYDPLRLRALNLETTRKKKKGRLWKSETRKGGGGGEKKLGKGGRKGSGITKSEERDLGEGTLDEKGQKWKERIRGRRGKGAEPRRRRRAVRRGPSILKKKKRSQNKG